MMKLCSSAFLSKVMQKNAKSRHLDPILGKLGVIDTRPWLMARWKPHGRLSIRRDELFFAIY